jgi:hypothetical protein
MRAAGTVADFSAPTARIDETDSQVSMKAAQIGNLMFITWIPWLKTDVATANGYNHYFQITKYPLAQGPRQCIAEYFSD